MRKHQPTQPDTAAPDERPIEGEPSSPSGDSAPDAVTIFSDPHSQAAIRSMWAVDSGDFTNWQRPEDRPPYYLDPNHKVMVYVPGQAVEAAWQTVLALDDDKVSTFIICMGKWFADTTGAEGMLRSTRIHVSDVLGFRGVKKHHKGGYRREQKQEARRDILTLSDIWVRSNERIWEMKGSRKRQKEVVVDSRLVEVAIESDVDIFGEETPYAFRVRPGDWAIPYLGEHNRMTAMLLRPVMAYDARQGVERIAMRLGIYLTMQWRIRSGHRTYAQPWLVRTLFEGAYLPLDPDHRLRGRIREQFEAALDLLQRDGVHAGWQYERWDEDGLPSRGWFSRWLGWTVSVTPPPAVVEHYKDIHRRRQRAISAAKTADRKQARSDSNTS